jgi:hypothetical protein
MINPCLLLIVVSSCIFPNSCGPILKSETNLQTKEKSSRDTIKMCIWSEYSLSFYENQGVLIKKSNFVRYTNEGEIGSNNYLQGYYVARRPLFDSSYYKIELFNEVNWLKNEIMYIESLGKEDQLKLIEIDKKWHYGLFQIEYIVHQETKSLQYVPIFNKKGNERDYMKMFIPTYLIEIISLTPIQHCGE